MKKFSNVIGVVLLGAASLTFGSAFAGTISGQDGFGNPTLPGATAVIDFNSQANATFSTLALSGVTFTGVGGNLRTDNSYPNNYNGRGARYMDNNAGSTASIRFDFASAVSGFAFNWGASDIQWTLSSFDALNNLIGSFAAPITHASNAGDYIGLTGVGIKYATLTASGGDWIFIDNFTIAGSNGNNVPEPATIALLGLGLLGFAAARRRKQ